MKRFNTKVSKLILLLIFSTTVTSAQQKVKKALFIIVDGISADAIEKINTPNLRLIASEGKYFRAHVGGDKNTYSQTPTISAVGYNSLLTGTWVNKHNVWDNDIVDPNYHYPTLFRLFKDQYPNKKIAVYSSWLDNRTKLVGDGLKATKKIHVDYHADGYELDSVNFKSDKEGDRMHKIDEKVVAQAFASIKKDAPDLSWVYLEYTDDMGHAYGDSPQFYKAIEMMDKQVGKIWEAIQYRQKNFKEDWQIFITTDHGRSESTGKNHGGQSSRERSTWMVTNAKDLNNYVKYYEPGIVDIMPTIARFMNIDIPAKYKMEIDGTSLTGPLSIVNLKAELIQDNIDVSWKSMNKDEKVKIYISTTNNVKTGQPDDYKLQTEVSADTEHTSISVKDIPSKFYKVVIVGTYNTVNKWIKTGQQ
jgi:predicted AlkP superfamily pyrophosphatase or phosphodiesterase